jgi:L,D-transpeptidase catalytic domain
MSRERNELQAVNEVSRAYPQRRMTSLMLSRRFLLRAALCGVASAIALPAVPVLAETADGELNPDLLRRALGALEQHRERIVRRDIIGIADFSLPSRAPRFHLMTLADGAASSHLVAHGKGSDPAHTGWLEHFSNEPHSHATSSGAYLTGERYVGAHGHSMRLEGLDPTNSNAAARAIVVHSAWYVSEQIVRSRGALGRSLGCFAFATSSLEEIMQRLGPGRLIYADKG